MHRHSFPTHFLRYRMPLQLHYITAGHTIDTALCRCCHMHGQSHQLICSHSICTGIPFLHTTCAIICFSGHVLSPPVISLTPPSAGAMIFTATHLSCTACHITGTAYRFMCTSSLLMFTATPVMYIPSLIICAVNHIMCTASPII